MAFEKNTTLKPGRVPGRERNNNGEVINDAVDKWDDSMADAIENAYIEEWKRIHAYDNPPVEPPKTNDELRLLFVAIAQGVARHLAENFEAFKIDVLEVEEHFHLINTGGTSSNTGFAGKHKPVAKMEKIATTDLIIE